jgi:hypothetical protein
MSVHSEIKRITTNTLLKMKSNGERIAMLTAYDFSMARIVDEAGIDVILVGDSASNVMAGHETTLPITLDQMIYHAQSVIRGVKRALVVVDLPFGSYQGNSRVALESAIRIMKESEAHAVKLEGGEEVGDSIKRRASINLVLTPFGRKKKPKPTNSVKTLNCSKIWAVSVWFWKKSPQNWPPRSVKAWPFRQSASERAAVATVKCWFCTICWASIKNFNPAFYAATQTSLMT